MQQLFSGLDEAGRGPVIGPLVVAIATIKEGDLAQLERMGVKDSKLLSPSQRERIYVEITKVCNCSTAILSPKDIDSAVQSTITNLNWLEADTIAKLINKHKPDTAIVDCPSSNIKAFTTYLSGKLEYNPKIVAEHKADSKFPLVAAASIIAKVARDREIAALKRKYNVEFGSGYPSDPLTIRFVKENHSNFDFFRKSWSTWKEAAMPNQKRLGEF